MRVKAGTQQSVACHSRTAVAGQYSVAAASLPGVPMHDGLGCETRKRSTL